MFLAYRGGIVEVCIFFNNQNSQCIIEHDLMKNKKVDIAVRNNLRFIFIYIVFSM